jgi:hypothetical protein
MNGYPIFPSQGFFFGVEKDVSIFFPFDQLFVPQGYDNKIVT